MKVRKMAVWCLLSTAILFVGAGASVYVFRYMNSDALWQIVSQQCVPIATMEQQAAPCVEVDLERRYVLFKDRRGSLHDLLMPTTLISGIESPILLEALTPDYMVLAWERRHRLSVLAGKVIPDSYLVLALNSRRGRTQDHLHVHIACLQPHVHATITRLAPQVGQAWSALAEPLGGQSYWGRRIKAQRLGQQKTFELLSQYLQTVGRAPGDNGLAMVQLPDGDFLLLTTGVNLWALDLGSTERLQDFECHLMTDTNH